MTGQYFHIQIRKKCDPVIMVSENKEESFHKSTHSTTSAIKRRVA